jgi:membrane-associated phospholipid phosphatase
MPVISYQNKMWKDKPVLTKISNFTLFLIIIPAFLVVWAECTGNLTNLPLPENLFWSYGLLVIGFCLVIPGVFYLNYTSESTSANTITQERCEKEGIYAFIKNPIPLGIIFISFGLSVLIYSSSGFWIVSPLVGLISVIYVVRIEYLRSLIPVLRQKPRPFFSLPLGSDETPSPKDRLVAFIFAYIPFRAVYQSFIFVGTSEDALCTNLSFENQWPVLEYTTIVYDLLYPVAILIPFIIKSKKGLKNFVTDVLFVTAVSGIIFFVFPLYVHQRSFIPQTFLGNLLLFDRAHDGEAGALPSFHVIWAFLAARYFTIRNNRLKWLWYLFAVLISASCITTGNHSILDVIAGVAIFELIVYRIQIWYLIRKLTGNLSVKWRRIHLIQQKSNGNKRQDLYEVYPLQPQLYFICSHFITVLLLIRLYTLEMPVTFITGIYLLLNGLMLFLEESLLRETQKNLLPGKKMSHCLPIAIIISGIVLTTIPVL